MCITSIVSWLELLPLAFDYSPPKTRSLKNRVARPVVALPFLRSQVHLHCQSNPLSHQHPDRKCHAPTSPSHTVCGNKAARRGGKSVRPRRLQVLATVTLEAHTRSKVTKGARTQGIIWRGDAVGDVVHRCEPQQFGEHSDEQVVGSHMQMLLDARGRLKTRE